MENNLTQKDIDELTLDKRIAEADYAIQGEREEVEETLKEIREVVEDYIDTK